MSSFVHAGNITESIHNTLSDRECSIFDKTLASYHKRRDVNGLVEALALILNTNRKRQLLVPIRDIYIKPSDLIKFNDLAVKHGLALPSRGPVKKQFSRTESGPKEITVKREKSGEWGFSIRGGVDQGIGIFVGWVDPSGSSFKAGLQIGDYVHRVNEINVENSSCSDVEQILHNRRKVTLLVTSHGRVPGFQNANKFYEWIDREGQVTFPPEEYDINSLPPSLRLSTQPFPPLDPPAERIVTINVGSDKELGISIRGGAEHGLGVYISGVDFGSLAAINGLRIGDQIMDVNGISFFNIQHSDAVRTLKSQQTLVMKIKDIGKLPHSRLPPGQTNRHSQPPSMLAPVTPIRRVVSGGDVSSVKGSVIADGEPSQDNQVVLRKTTASAKDTMNDAARTILAKTEMSSLTYYISQYEHKQINIDELTINLLQLLNTNNKMQLLSEIRNIIKPEDLDAFNEMTLDKEINARKGFQFAMGSQNSLSSGSDGDAAPKMRHHRPNELDEIPQRESPNPKKRQIPTFHIPPPPPGQPLSASSPGDQQLIAETMKDRRQKLHESVASADSWEEMDGSGTLKRQREEKQRHLEAIRAQAEESMRKEIEEQIRKEAEARIQKEREEEQRRQEEIERQREEEEEERRREEEERRREERRREEEERRREEEERRKREERKREEKARKEEERARREEEERQMKEQEEQEDLSELPEKERRKILRERGRKAEERRLKRLWEEQNREDSDSDDEEQREDPSKKEKELAEQMLAVKLRNKQQKSTTIQRAVSGGVNGKLMKVTVEKVNKKLGLAVDGGANTKQKAVIIRQIVPGGSAYETGHDLEVGQHILFINGQPLKQLNHKDAVMAIKNAFDGPIGKEIEFVVLDPDQ